MLTQSEKFPAALAQLHSAYLHSMGVADAVRLVEQTLRRAVMARAEAFTVSRIDLYASSGARSAGWSTSGGEPVAEDPVWRVEFQIRRPVLVDHGLRTVDEALDDLQDLWRYCSHRWLTYRAPRPDARERRWSLDPVDVRPRHEFHAGHLPGAISVPVQELERAVGPAPS